MLWQAMHELVDANVDVLPADAPGAKVSAEADTDTKPVKP
jgi:hypothetical protein